MKRDRLHECKNFDPAETHVTSPCPCGNPHCAPQRFVVLDVGREHKERNKRTVVGFRVEKARKRG